VLFLVFFWGILLTLYYFGDLIFFFFGLGGTLAPFSRVKLLSFSSSKLPVFCQSLVALLLRVAFRPAFGASFSYWLFRAIRFFSFSKLIPYEIEL